MTSWRQGHRFVVVTVVVALAAAGALTSCQLPGPKFVVNTTVDAVDRAPGDGKCEATAGHNDCTLRAAVMEANAESGPNDIEIGDGRAYTLSLGGPRMSNLDSAAQLEDGARKGDLDITGDVSINGHSSISANGIDRVFEVLSGTLVMEGPTVKGGFIFRPPIPNGTNPPIYLGNADGGGIRVQPGATLILLHVVVQQNVAQDGGGGIESRGTTSIADSQISNNTAAGVMTAPDLHIVFGGGIETNGPVTISRTTIADNKTANAGSGGAIAAFGPADVEIDNSTLARNRAAAVAGVVGGLYSNTTSAKYTIRQSTFSGYTQQVLLGATFDITASTFANISAPVIGGGTPTKIKGSAFDDTNGICVAPLAITSGGYNVLDDSTCHVAATGDRQSTAPLLGALAYNGGSTQTHLPAANSPLLNAIPLPTSGLCASGGTDQRGQPRPAGPKCDIGSVERAP